jgi:hypothetical protein
MCHHILVAWSRSGGDQGCKLPMPHFVAAGTPRILDSSKVAAAIASAG